MKLTVATLNIEGDQHLPEVTRFIQNTRPDVVCLQEVFEDHYGRLTKNFDMKGKFLPTVFIDVPGKPGFKKKGAFGIAMLSRIAGIFGSVYYFKRREKLPFYGGCPNASHRVLVWLKIHTGPTIATTHFTWSKGGRATNKQRKELKMLIKLLDAVKPDILCGDFNAPRGGDIWSELSKRFLDNIPPEVSSTIDPQLHYTKGLRVVVDGFFTIPTSNVRVKSVKLVDGVSDHQAVIAKIETR